MPFSLAFCHTVEDASILNSPGEKIEKQPSKLGGSPSSSSSSKAPSAVRQEHLAVTLIALKKASDSGFRSIFRAGILVVPRSNPTDFKVLTVQKVYEIVQQHGSDGSSATGAGADSEGEKPLQIAEDFQTAELYCPASDDEFVYKVFSIIPGGFHSKMKLPYFNDTAEMITYNLMVEDLPALRDFNFSGPAGGNYGQLPFLHTYATCTDSHLIFFQPQTRTIFILASWRCSALSKRCWSSCKYKQDLCVVLFSFLNIA